MGEFFNGWRSKVGVLTLSLACVCMAGWMRSRTHVDYFLCSSSTDTTESVYACEGLVGWGRLSNSQCESKLPVCDWRFENVSDRPHLLNHRDLEWRWQWYGFGQIDNQGALKRMGIIPYWSMHEPQTLITGWVFPYWSLVILLTLISAWLLLSKSRKSTPIKIAELFPAEEA